MGYSTYDRAAEKFYRYEAILDDGTFAYSLRVKSLDLKMAKIGQSSPQTRTRNAHTISATPCTSRSTPNTNGTASAAAIGEPSKSSPTSR
jgi:hypothetical protein